MFTRSLHKAGREAQSLPEAIAKAYRLTPSELKVVLAVVEIGGVPEVAALGIAETTVRADLGRFMRRPTPAVRLIS